MHGTCISKIKEGVFVVSQIKKLMQDVKFEDQLSEAEKSSMGIVKKYHYQCLE